ncbi:hypothetical protein BMF94_6628 [Rhodotorula taiwanensis]|uniref:Uncharacterized protein n=1 Tax=Rhodotorula taiwanensis TaxID=741276 RepID=A0A2S5B0N7_9BASI|nr:hypothetical protein BMF94_6628 [Rhodotorula taiwanensis]
MEDEIAELADSAQAARREAQALANRTARAEADVETLGKQYDTTLGHIKKTHEAALAAQGKIDKEKLKREQAASEKAIKRLDQVARGALEGKEAAVRRMRALQFQLEQAKLKARAPLANKNNNTLARKPAFAPSKLGDLDLFAEAKYALHSGPHFSASPENVTDHCNFRSAYFPRATEQLKQAELELKGWKPVATVHELTAAAVVLDRYFLLLDIFNLGEIDVQNLLLGAEDFARLVVERRSPSLADLLQTLRRPSESLLLASETELKGQALDFRRKWKKALRDLSWEVKLHKADVKKLERCEATIEAMAQEKGHLWARCLRAESERARLETVVGGLEAAVEAVSASSTVATAIASLERAVNSMSRLRDAQVDVRRECSFLREEAAFEGLRALFGGECESGGLL